MNIIPTAEEFRKQYLKQKGRVSEEEFMIEFARMHVETALRVASREAYTKSIPFTDDEEVDKMSIINAYPSTNIK